MAAKRMILMIATTLVTLLFQLLSSLASFGLAILIGMAMGVTVPVIFRNSSRWWMLSSALLGTLLGSLTAYSVSHRLDRDLAFLAPLLTAAVGITATLLLRYFGQGNPRCELCKQLVRQVSYECPRCELKICDRNDCWDSEFSRCQACKKAGVKVLPITRDWWLDKFRQPLPTAAKCFLCGLDHSHQETFGCQGCGRPYCVDCWDAQYGQCHKCKWPIPELEPSTIRQHF